MSIQMIAVIFGIIILLVFVIMSSQSKDPMLEHITTPTTSLTDIDIEALQNISSMYNSTTGTLTVGNITATGDIACTHLTTTGKVTSPNFFGDRYIISYGTSKPADMTTILDDTTDPKASGVIYSPDTQTGEVSIKVKNGFNFTKYNDVTYSTMAKPEGYYIGTNIFSGQTPLLSNTNNGKAR